MAAFAPEQGESAVDLSGKFPGSTLGPTLAPPIALPDGGKDLYIQQDKFPSQFAADVASGAALLMAGAQRPITEGALGEPAPAAAWKTVPSWFIYGDRDKNIPPAALWFMAERAKSMKTGGGQRRVARGHGFQTKPGEPTHHRGGRREGAAVLSHSAARAHAVHW